MNASTICRYSTRARVTKASGPSCCGTLRIKREFRALLLTPAFLLLCGLGILGMDAAAQGDCAALRGDEAVLPGEFIPDNGWKGVSLPPVGDLDQAMTELDYQDEVPFAYAIDLNGDRVPEYLLTTSNGRLCGTGGCPHVLLAGKSMKRIGEFFGHLAILDARVNGTGSSRRSVDTEVWQRVWTRTSSPAGRIGCHRT